MNISFITDPLVTSFGAVRPAILLSKALSKKNHNIKIISPKHHNKVEIIFRNHNIDIIDIGPKFSYLKGIPTFDAWLRNLFFNNNYTENYSDIVINTSSCVISNSDFYYAQGPMINALSDMMIEMPFKIRSLYRLNEPILKKLEEKFIRKIRVKSRSFISNSEFCKDMYKKLGVSTDYVINPPLDCNLFSPKNRNRSEDYILSYFGTFGKESNIEVIKNIANLGIKIKIFGTPPANKKILLDENIEYFGQISNEELVNLYQNALFTLFAFKHEPFGYIPVESMACGTPVLTFNMQGPSETVIDEKTGWLVNSKNEFVKKAEILWKEGYETNIRNMCRKRSLNYDIKKITNEWLNKIYKRKI